MFAQGPRPTRTMAKILPRQIIKPVTWVVDNRRFGTHPYLAAGSDSAHVEFGVFIMGESFIVAVDALEKCTIEGRMMTVSDKTRSGTYPVGRATIAQSA